MGIGNLINRLGADGVIIKFGLKQPLVMEDMGEYNMNNKDLLEIKKRFKKDHCTISRMCGCYVNGEKNIVAKYRETFLNLEESEFFKYLEISRRVLSGAMGNNLLELHFAEESGRERQALLMDLKRSGLKNEDILDRVYQDIIDTYEYTGNFLILFFADTYDVMAKTQDNLKLDESEEIYEYILCAICPVTLSDPGLAYEAREKRMRAHQRDWVVEPPANGFLFPAFTDRSSDVNGVLYYSKNPKEPHEELMREVLGCESLKTTALHRLTLSDLFREAVDNDEEKAGDLVIEFQEQLNHWVEGQKGEVSAEEAEPMLLTPETIQELLEDKVAGEVLRKIEEAYGDYFGGDVPTAERILDPKIIKAAQIREKEQALEQQVENLKEMLAKASDEGGEETGMTVNRDEMAAAADNDEFAVVVKVRPDRAAEIKTQLIDGRKCLIIPLDEDDQATINGENRPL